jgi:hypothetical protein
MDWKRNVIVFTLLFGIFSFQATAQDTAEGDITLNQDQLCEPYDVTRGLEENHRGEEVWAVIECAEDGQSYNVIEYCDENEEVEIEDGDYNCVSPQASTDNNKNELGTPLDIFMLLALVGLIAYAFGKNNSEE